VLTEALKILTPFAASYLFETRFSLIAVMKTKQRNCLFFKNDLFLGVCTVEPCIEELGSNIS
jgi:hypothetical protein